MHYIYDTPPSEKALPMQAWEKEHRPNMTGTVYAYAPKGSLASGGQRAKTAGDYEAWNPDA
jgi:NADH:ubiquinone oxidoreductase subunit